MHENKKSKMGKIIANGSHQLLLLVLLMPLTKGLDVVAVLDAVTLIELETMFKVFPFDSDWLTSAVWTEDDEAVWLNINDESTRTLPLVKLFIAMYWKPCIFDSIIVSFIC